MPINENSEFAKNIKLFRERVNRCRDAGLYLYFKPIEKTDGAWVHTEGRRKLTFTTYSYLGLINHPRIIAAAQAATQRYGAGTHGVRILGGTFDIHEKLEKRIAEFTGREAAVAFSTGYTTNLATINAIVGRHDYVISDRRNHASIVDGSLLSPGKYIRFHHNDMSDLESKLQRLPERTTKLVVADAVFSMDGDIFNLPDAYGLCKRYDAILMVDEAHSVGVLGENGRGIEEHFDMPGVVDVKMGTLSKAIPGIGGYIAGSADLVNYIRHHARAFVFSAAVPAAVVAGQIEAFDVLEHEGKQLRAALKRNVDYFIDELNSIGFNTGNTETQIVPIIIGNEDQTLMMAKYCQVNDLFVVPVLPPAVYPGEERLRVNVTAAHTIDDLRHALRVFHDAGIHAGVIAKRRNEPDKAIPTAIGTVRSVRSLVEDYGNAAS
jgi:8-amino-7-oxononanoate synthase